MSKSIWNLTSEATKYAQSRPSHPQAIAMNAIAFLKEKYTGPITQAVDVGCGTGISTTNLSGKFQNVLGVDASEAMVEQAQLKGYHNSLRFMHGTAEKLPASDESAQLMLVGRAIHYFDTVKFYKEVDRVLVNDGVLCYYSVHFPSVSCPTNTKFGAHVHQVFWRFLKAELHDYWPVNAYNKQKIDWDRRNYYVNVIPAPYTESKVDETVSVPRDISLLMLASELRTYSPFVNYAEREGEEKAAKLLDRFFEECLSAEFENVGKEETNLVATDNFFMVLSRKSGGLQ